MALVVKDRVRENHHYYRDWDGNSWGRGKWLSKLFRNW